MKWLVLAVALLLLVLFAAGVYGLALDLGGVLASGEYTDPLAIIGIIDMVILLLLVVEVFRDLMAYIRDEAVLPIVIDIAIISMARKIITFRSTAYATTQDALVTAATYTLLLLASLAAYYFVRIRTTD